MYLQKKWRRKSNEQRKQIEAKKDYFYRKIELFY